MNVRLVSDVRKGNTANMLQQLMGWQIQAEKQTCIGNYKYVTASRKFTSAKCF